MSKPEEDMSCDMVELMDLPEPVLLHIMSYFDLAFLRDVAAKVSMEWKRLAHSPVLWADASFYYSKELSAENFARNILVTPYLYHLSVFLEGEGEVSSTVLEALVSTRCKLYKLTLSVVEYNQELVLFLQQHPELKHLQLLDYASDNCYAASVAATVCRLAPSLMYLDLSQSRLMWMPKAGLWLASPSGPHEVHNSNLDDTSIDSPHSSLDLRNVDNDECEIVKKERPQGLLDLKFYPERGPEHTEPSSTRDTAAKNLSAFLLAHRHTLQQARVCFPSREVLMALGQCTKVQFLMLDCDSDGSGFCAMLQTMKQSSLWGLDLIILSSMGAQRLNTVLQTLTVHAPLLASLGLFIRRGAGSIRQRDTLFPGFKSLKPLLASSLQMICFDGFGPLGRAQLLELASMGTADAKLALVKLHLQNCPCSARGRWDECRERAQDALRAAMPSLDYSVTFSPMEGSPALMYLDGSFSRVDKCRCNGEDEGEWESGSEWDWEHEGGEWRWETESEWGSESDSDTME